MSKKRIPSALRQNVWNYYVGNYFDSKCYVKWCKTTINPFTFEVGHNIPESKGGTTSLENLRPICSSCNKSMGNRYTIDEFSLIYGKTANANVTKDPSNKRDFCSRMFRCF